MKKLAFANNGLFFLVSGIGFAFLVITRRAINNKNISTLNTTFFILSGFMLLFLAIAFFSIRRTMRARIKTEEQLTIFKSVINSSDDFIVCKNMSSVIISWNPGAESIFGYTAHEILGQPFSLLIVPSRKDNARLP